MSGKNKNKSAKLTETPHVSCDNLWSKITALSTAGLLLVGAFVGLRQTKILEQQTHINALLAGNELRAVLELSFADDFDFVWVKNTGRLTATDITYNILLSGREYKPGTGSAGTFIALNPGERFDLKIPKPTVDLSSHEAVVLDVILRYASEGFNKDERWHRFYWIDALQMWSKGQWY